MESLLLMVHKKNPTILIEEDTMQKDGQTLTKSPGRLPTVSPARKRCLAEVATELCEIRAYFCVFFVCVGPTAYVTADEQNDR